MAVFHKPANLAEALEIRSKGAIPFAGGTDIMVRFRAKNGLDPKIPGPVLFVDKIAELQKLTIDGKDLVIGASVPAAIIANAPGARATYNASGLDSTRALNAIPELLRAAAADLGAPALRQQATLAGNIANASPAGDTVVALYALDAILEIASSHTKRSIPIDKFIIGPGKNTLADNELIVAIRIPDILPDRSSETAPPIHWQYWRKIGTRRANALTKVSLAASARIVGGQIQSAAMAYGAVSPTVVRSHEADELLKTWTISQINKKTAQRFIDTISPCIKPIDDQRSTANYRKTVALNLSLQALESLANIQ